MVISPVLTPRLFEWRLRAADPWNVAPSSPMYFFRRGTEALTVALLALRRRRGCERLTVWMPAYICRDVPEALPRELFCVRWYAIDEALAVDWDDVHTRVGRAGGDVFVLVHTFGFGQDRARARQECDAMGLDLVEDGAHLTPTPSWTVPAGKAIVWSMRKVFAVPEGGALTVATSLAPFLPSVPLVKRTHALRWRAKRVAQSAATRAGWNWYQHRLDVLDEAPVRLADPRHLSPHGQRLCEQSLRTASSAAARRRLHARRLLACLARWPQASIPRVHVAEHDTPYGVPVYIAGSPEEWRRAFVERGVPVVRWPQLPAEVLSQPDAYDHAHRLARHLLLFPVHQNLAEADLQHMERLIETMTLPV